MPRTVKTFEIGQKASFSKTITEADVVAFAGVSGDFNPLHIVEDYAKTTMFGQRIAHGMLTASLISTVLGMILPGPGCVYLSQSVKFVKPVHIGDTLTATVEVTEWAQDRAILKLSNQITNQNDDIVITGESVTLVRD
ncbi:MAG TPA: MaoC family dehydratase [Blastocatellia bacterium]|nr:MaoC family dehydratase [Blastocatellia bacterium]